MDLSPEIVKKYVRWCGNAISDIDLGRELHAMQVKHDLIEDAFYKDLEFGTGGLRGVIGAGTNRMNVYTVGKASQGLANYVKKNLNGLEGSVAVSYDSRIKSDLFAKTAATVFAMNGLKVWIYSELMPTPCLSYAVRALHCNAGVMVTASHNPSKYNGYKVYGADGCQITTEAADAILDEINHVDEFRSTLYGDFDALMEEGKIAYVPDYVYDDFVAEVKKQSVLQEDIDRNVAIVYTPLNGTGLKPVTRVLNESGFTNIRIVEEQKDPDGNFPTCPYPNPEIREAMQLGMDYAWKNRAELLLATDPDCDRVGIAVIDENRDYVLLSGNETGCLLFDYICQKRIENGTMPEHPVMVKTIVSIDMADRIAEHYGVEVKNVLTGFKFIGEQIALLEKEGHESDYIFGFEESYGYLTGSYVRDKDAVDAAFMICEMFAYYKSRGISLLEKLQELYRTYGFYKNATYSFEFEGSAGVEKMKEIMDSFRGEIDSFGEKKVELLKDYENGIDGLPKSNVLKFFLSGHSSLVFRPSGTEPKLKVYVSVCGSDPEDAAAQEKALADTAKAMME